MNDFGSLLDICVSSSLMALRADVLHVVFEKLKP